LRVMYEPDSIKTRQSCRTADPQSPVYRLGKREYFVRRAIADRPPLLIQLWES
jgi:hypothetical protein